MTAQRILEINKQQSMNLPEATGSSCVTEIPLALSAGQFCLRLHSSILKKDGFRKNDLVVVDAHQPISSGKIVSVDGQFLIRKLLISGKTKTLVANEKIASLNWQEEQMQILGVVVYLLRSI